MQIDIFQSCGHCWVFQICWHIDYSTFTVSSFRIWNRSAWIPSLPLVLFILVLPKAHLTSLSRISGSRWVITSSWLSWEGEGGTNWKPNSETYTLPYVKQIPSGNLLYDVGCSNPVLCDDLQGWDGAGGGMEVQEEGDIYTYLWLIHGDAWQKSTQCCEIIILQLKIQ